MSAGNKTGIVILTRKRSIHKVLKLPVTSIASVAYTMVGTIFLELLQANSKGNKKAFGQKFVIVFNSLDGVTIKVSRYGVDGSGQWHYCVDYSYNLRNQAE